MKGSKPIKAKLFFIKGKRNQVPSKEHNEKKQRIATRATMANNA